MSILALAQAFSAPRIQKARPTKPHRSNVGKPRRPRAFTAGPIRLLAWRRDRGISATTAWRFQQRGWLTVVKIAGIPYVTADAIAEFERRAEAGELAICPPNEKKNAIKSVNPKRVWTRRSAP